MHKFMSASFTAKRFFGSAVCGLLLLSMSGCLKEQGEGKETPGEASSNTLQNPQREYYLSIFSSQKEDSDKISNYLTQKQLRVVASQESGGTRIYAYPMPDKNNLAFIMDEFQQVQKLAKASRQPTETSVQVFTNQHKIQP